MNCIPWPWFSLCSTAPWIQVDLSVITSSLFLDFGSCVLLGKPHTSWPSFSLVSKMSEVQDTKVIDQVIDQETGINLEPKIVDLQEAIEATLNNRQNNLSKPWKDAINLELKALCAALKENKNLLETFTH